MITFTTNGTSLMVKAKGEDAELVVGMAAGLMYRYAHGGGWGIDYIHDESGFPDADNVPAEYVERFSAQEKHTDGDYYLAESLVSLARLFSTTPAFRARVEEDILFRAEVNRRLKHNGKRPYYPEVTVTVPVPPAP